jgi:hypothetical protein
MLIGLKSKVKDKIWVVRQISSPLRLIITVNLLKMIDLALIFNRDFMRLKRKSTGYPCFNSPPGDYRKLGFPGTPNREPAGCI